ncbi:hypothetical protein JD844_007344 [Phrynosoma platyrhinos]|uniref:Uncharacterized protein n=1 Tax=Phrynosoma platyrhinos TaxID=52577 RepID=A0ABQ7T2U4_PHRPL|nr:hypothetical protein JD844_007344 [Phrynosoma platyrhinos]
MYASHEDIGYEFGDKSKEQEKKLKSNRDIDGGWAWMVVLSSFLVHVLVMGSQMALGILNMEWLEEFSQSRGLTAWVSSLSLIIIIECYEINVFIVICHRSFYWSVHQHLWMPENCNNWRNLKCFRMDFEFLCLKCALPFHYIWRDS